MLKKIQIYSLLITISFCFTQCRNNTVSKSKNKKFEENFGQKKTKSCWKLGFNGEK